MLWKSLISSIVLVVVVLTSLAVWFDISDTTDWPYVDTNETVWAGAEEDSVDVGVILKEWGVDGTLSVGQRIMSAFGINYFQDEGESQTATYYIKEVINWALVIAWLIALIVILVGFYKMFFSSDNEEGFKSARKMVINAAIALAVIALAWFITSWLFFIFEEARDDLTYYVPYALSVLV